jgi:hypothetical protein
MSQTHELAETAAFLRAVRSDSIKTNHRLAAAAAQVEQAVGAIRTLMEISMNLSEKVIAATTELKAARVTIADQTSQIAALTPKALSDDAVAAVNDVEPDAAPVEAPADTVPADAAPEVPTA